MNRYLAYAGLALLVAFQCWKGLVPAFTRLDTDFPNYYVAARLVIEGRDLSGIYDDAWFQQEIQRHGIDQAGRFTPFPPVTALVMVPLAAFLGPLDALRVWTLCNIALAAAVVLLLVRLNGRSVTWNALLLLLTGIGLANNFRFGQMYLLIAAALLFGLLLYRRGHVGSAGIVWALAASVKYLPAVLFLHCAVRGKWRAVAFGCATLAAVHLLSGVVLGFGVVERYLSGVVLGHLAAEMPDPTNPVYQSWPSLLRRLAAAAEMPGILPAGLTLVATLSFGLLAAAYYRTWTGHREDQAEMIQMALLLLCTMTLLPASATYHFVLLAVPAGIVLAPPSAAGFRARAAAVCYAAIGFIPYSLLAGANIVLRYPRLWLATALFVLSVAGIWRKSRPETETVFQTV